MRRILLFVALLLLPAQLQAEDRLFRLSLAVAVVGHSVDLAETEHCLGAGTCRELNRWLARYDSPTGFAIAKMSVASLSLWGSAKLHESHPKLATTLNFGMGAGFLALGVRNGRISRSRQ